MTAFILFILTMLIHPILMKYFGVPGGIAFYIMLSGFLFSLMLAVFGKGIFRVVTLIFLAILLIPGLLLSIGLGFAMSGF
ncbi:hypothetical protein [Virgibacillus sp. DJP39]|uniref:hypothetical protein n=1 Tax=Virgibacillus sp. DJP39 TaxID=3409790 RepID=UPI003BB5EEAF